MIGKPIGEIENGARKKSCFHHAQNQPQQVERGAACNEHGSHGGQPPADHEERDPELCADFVEDEVAGETAQGVADEEQASAQRIGGFGDSDRGLQGLLGKADVGAVEKRDHVHQHEIRRQPSDCPRNRAAEINVGEIIVVGEICGGAGGRNLVQRFLLNFDQHRAIGQSNRRRLRQTDRAGCWISQRIAVHF